MMTEPNSASPTWATEVQELTKSFGNHLALGGIDLKIKQGETVAIFGPNGAGKTTLIKILATIMNPSSGSILINGLNLKNNAEEIRRRIGVVTHQTFLYGNLTAYENLNFYGRMYDIPARQERIQEITAVVGMTGRLHDRVGTLSRGMQQRLSIARCLLHKPSIILLDEPDTGLDQQASTMLRAALQTKREEKRTIILTTHSLERGLELCSNLLLLVQGKIVYQESRQGLNLTDLKKTYQHYTRVTT